jgi:hypothetical protein
MKAEVTKQEDNSFKPVSITLSFETQDELDSFGALFNCASVCEALGKVIEERHGYDSIIRRVVEEAGGDTCRLHGSLNLSIKETYI